MKTNKICEFHLYKENPNRIQLTIYRLKAYLKKFKDQTTIPHKHSFYQIIYFKKGTGKHFIDHKEYKVEDETLFLIDKNQVHFFDTTKDYEGFLIQFNDIMLLTEKSNINYFYIITSFNASTGNKPYINTAKNQVVTNLILEIKNELKNKNKFANTIIVKKYLQILLLNIYRQNIEEELNSKNELLVNDSNNELLLKFKQLLESHYKNGYSIQDYAKVLKVSSRTLYNLTNEKLNKNPLDVVNERIILEAKRLILYSDFNISQISYELGFKECSNFVKFFKKHTGITPIQFKNSIKLN